MLCLACKKHGLPCPNISRLHSASVNNSITHTSEGDLRSGTCQTQAIHVHGNGCPCLGGRSGPSRRAHASRAAGDIDLPSPSDSSPGPHLRPSRLFTRRSSRPVNQTLLLRRPPPPPSPGGVSGATPMLSTCRAPTWHVFVSSRLRHRSSLAMTNKERVTRR